MKKTLSSFLFLSSALFAAPLSYNIQEQDYRFSTYFDMHDQGRYVGTVTKAKYTSARNRYELYDENGQFQALGVCRFFSLGLFYVWAKEIDVYDASGKSIGMIDGQVGTVAGAKFSIYDGKGQLLGIAYLDTGSAGFAIYDPIQDKKVIGRLKRNFVQDTVDNWDISCYESEKLDSRLLKIFSAFAIDYQEYFKEDH